MFRQLITRFVAQALIDESVVEALTIKALGPLHAAPPDIPSPAGARYNYVYIHIYIYIYIYNILAKNEWVDEFCERGLFSLRKLCVCTYTWWRLNLGS